MVRITLFANWIIYSITMCFGPWGFSQTHERVAIEEVVFSAPVDISNGSVQGVSSLDAGDLDGDGKADLVVIEGGMHAEGKTFAWFSAPRNPGGDWTRYELNANAPLKRFLGSARLIDVEGDGDLDLIVSSDMHSGEKIDADVLVFLNPRPERPAESEWDFHYIGEGLPYHHINDMEVGDMDGDGRPDVVIRSLEPNAVHIFFQDDPSSWERKSIATLLEQSEGLAIGDLNGDARREITFTGYVLRAPESPRVERYERIAVDADFARINQNTKEALGDIDGDGRPDLLLSPAEAYRGGRAHDLAWYRNPGGDLKGLWRKHVIVSETNNLHTVKLARVNGDAALDVVAGAAWDPRSIRIYYNLGGGDFSPPQILSDMHGLYSGLVVDFDADGDADIIGQETYAKSSTPWLYENISNSALDDNE